MTSDEVIDALEVTGKLMELHDENPFKAKAFTNAAFRLSKMRYDFSGKSREEVAAIEGVGKSIADKAMQLFSTDVIPELEDLLRRTPAGVIEMLSVKGLGPKKVRQLWSELKIESVGELLYACNENRLITLKGFGEKTQAQIKKQIEFRNSNLNKFHYAAVEGPFLAFIDSVRKRTGAEIVLTGDLARKALVVDQAAILYAGQNPVVNEDEKELPLVPRYLECLPEEFGYFSVMYSSVPAHLEQIGFESLRTKSYKTEDAVYEALGLQFVPAELREGNGEVELARKKSLPKLIEPGDLKGTLHNHTTYSDGIHTLSEMASYCMKKGLTYFGVCDHSRSAFYANGLPAERVLEQQKEIDKLNAGYKDFRILKGIESDILSDGSLDYDRDILSTFEFVVASIHSNLKMQEEKATARLIKAIENPFTTILGHPTGRLLLAREGYPIDHKKVIDACAANGVHIELNAHPYRLDIDWRWIPYCMEKGVFISINPDAHHTGGIDDMYWGVSAARKGMLTAAMCLNALPLEELLKKFSKRV